MLHELRQGEPLGGVHVNMVLVGDVFIVDNFSRDPSGGMASPQVLHELRQELLGVAVNDCRRQKGFRITLLSGDQHTIRYVNPSNSSLWVWTIHTCTGKAGC